MERLWNRSMKTALRILTFLGCLANGPGALFAATYHVNNATGSDENDGKTEASAFATIAKAVSACGTSDRLVLSNTGTPYHESLVLKQLGGTPRAPFVVEGSGAVLSGYRALPAARWEKVGDGLYLFRTPVRPHQCPYLADHGTKLPEKKEVAALDAGEFCWRRDHGIYFKCAPGKPLTDYELGATMLATGFTTVNASYIVCRDLVCEYFSNDGFNLHGDCRGLVLERVEARYNGNQGVSIHEAGGLVVRDAHLHHNGQGIVDVNASRSHYSGVLAERNGLGAGFNGGFHSMVDCVLRDNAQDQVDVSFGAPKHLPGGATNPVAPTRVYLKNVILSGSGNRAGVRVRAKGTLAMESSIIVGSDAGIVVHAGGNCHLTRSIVANCPWILRSDSEDFFRDFNLYGAGRLRWLGKDYGAESWAEFKAHAGNDNCSRIGPVTLQKTDDGSLRLAPGADGAAPEYAQLLELSPFPIQVRWGDITGAGGGDGQVTVRIGPTQPLGDVGRKRGKAEPGP